MATLTMAIVLTIATLTLAPSRKRSAALLALLTMALLTMALLLTTALPTTTTGELLQPDGGFRATPRGHRPDGDGAIVSIAIVTNRHSKHGVATVRIATVLFQSYGPQAATLRVPGCNPMYLRCRSSVPRSTWRCARSPTRSARPTHNSNPHRHRYSLPRPNFNPDPNPDPNPNPNPNPQPHQAPPLHGRGSRAPSTRSRAP